MKWKVIKSEYIFKDGPWLTIRKDKCELPNGKIMQAFYVQEYPEWASAFALTKDNKVLMIKQYRHGIEQITTEVPGGVVDKGEEPLTAIRRELLEETGWKIDEEDIYLALQNVKRLTGLHGRWEVVQTNPTVVLEVAHNEDGIIQMVRHIDHLNFDRLHIILGMVKDKEVNKVLSLLPKNASYYFTQAHIPRALDKERLQAQAQSFGLAGCVFDDVNLALKNALSNASPKDLIIVCGSIFLVAEVNSA